MEKKVAAIWARVSPDVQTSLPEQMARAKEKLGEKGYSVPQDGILENRQLKRALSIIRVSDRSQKYGYGLDSQWEDDVLQNAPSLGLYVSEELRREIQEPATGWERVKFTEVIEEAIDLYNHNQIAAVVFPRIDRETRFVFSSMPLLSYMLKTGLQVYFAREQLHLDPRDPEAVSTYLNKVGQSQAYVETMKVNLVRGKRKRAKRGLLPTGGVNLYGYDYDKKTGKRSINETQKSVIRKMVDWVLKERISLNEVCRRLMAEGMPAPKGGQRWSRGTVGRILRNEVYTGKTFCYKMAAIEPHMKKSRGGYAKTARRLLPRCEWIELPDGTTPQIVTPEEFGIIQRQLVKNWESSRRNQKFSYLLRGYVYCRKCGRKYYGVPEHGKRFYRCSGRSPLLMSPPCHNRGVNAEALESKVWKIVTDDVFDVDKILEANRKSDEDGDEPQLWQQELTDHKAKLTQLDNAETRLIRLFEFTPMSEAKFTQQHDELVNQRAATEVRITELQKLISDYHQKKLTEQELQAVLTIMCAIVKDLPDDDEELFNLKRRMLELLNLKVWVDIDSFSIDFKIPSIPIRERHIVSTQL